MRGKLYHFMMIVATAIFLLSCATTYEKEQAVSCKSAPLSENAFLVSCSGSLDTTKEELKSSFLEHAKKVCLENGYAGFKLPGEAVLPPYSVDLEMQVVCTR